MTYARRVKTAEAWRVPNRGENYASPPGWLTDAFVRGDLVVALDGEVEFPRCPMPKVRPGAWIVLENGRMFSMNDAEFRATFEQLPEAG